MTVLSPEPIDSIMQDSQASENSETNSNKTSEIAMTHLEEVIQHVVEEAIDYAEKPPEERTLPTLVRKVPPPPKPRPSLNVMNFGHQGMNQSSSNLNVGINMAQQFATMKGQNIPSQAMVQFNQVVQQNPHMISMQYNGGQYNANQLSQAAQLQQQYAQQFQLQQQAQQYQNTQSAAFAQMQQIQQQQAALAAVGPALVYANITDGQLNGNSSNQRGQNSLASHQLSNGSGQNGQNQGNSGSQSAVATTVQLTPQQAVAMQQAQMNAVYQLQTSGQQNQAATAVLAANQRWANAAAAAANQQYSQNSNQSSGQSGQSNQTSQDHAQLAHALQLQQQQQAQQQQQQQAQYMDAHRDQLARYVAYQQQQQAQQQNQ